MGKRKFVTLEAIVDDIIYFSLSASIGILAVFIFDIHWSFYQDSLFPLKFIFKTKEPYLIGALGSGILGLIWIKVFLFALKEKTFSKIKNIFRRLRNIKVH